MASSRIAAALLLLPVLARAQSAGERVYRKACLPCHGERGDGGGPAARWLDPRPRDFTTGVYKFRSTASGSLPLREDLIRTVSEGIPGSFMPAWKHHLEYAEIVAVVDYTLAFSPRAGDEAQKRVVPPEKVAPPTTAASIARGRELYRTMGCGECHGPRGRGDGPAVSGLRDDAGRPIAPLDFTIGLFKGGSAPLDVYRTFVTGLSGTPMPSYADALPDEADRWALVHFVSSLARRRGWFLLLFGPRTPWQ